MKYHANPEQFGLDTLVEQRILGTSAFILSEHPLLKLQALLGRKLPTIYSDKNQINNLIKKDNPPFVESYPCSIPNWNNTPRSGTNGIVIKGVTIPLFKEQLKRSLNRVRSRQSEQKTIFIKAWNEWAEGNHIEPNLQSGHKYLEAVKEAIEEEAHE